MGNGQIGPHEMLPPGTMIRIGNRRGNVVSCEYVRAVPSGQIAVHTVLMTDRIKRDYGKVWHWEPIQDKPHTVNYTAITVA